ncbi:unnamed protein product [Porites evermanni]|uniref:Uncharacterized protein n=1 Tax=Porites evermanni TaxID=104178 RepID=A0ABN8LDU4_9CNID|nr:unnamed protein product [Porites evermanni]
MLMQARERYARELAGPNETRRKISNVAPEEILPQLMRFKTSPFNIVLTYRVFSNDRDQLKKRYDIDYVRLTSSIFMGEFIEANNVHEDAWKRKARKPLTQILIPEVEFH